MKVERHLSGLALVAVVLLGMPSAGRGAPLSAYLVKDINPGVGDSDPNKLLDVNGTLFFEADDGVTGDELWISDGTSAGTVLVKDINPGSTNGFSTDYNKVGAFFLLEANDGVNGTELWVSDGTTAGTVLIKDINPGSGSSGITNLDLDFNAEYNGARYFEADDGTNGDELWRTDGTMAGTVMVKDINPGTGNSDPDHFGIANGILYFEADDGTSGDELWRTDGTPAGTYLVKDINPAGNSDPDFLIEIGNTLYFRANDNPTSGRELWKSDGTGAGTVLVKDINPGDVDGHFGTSANLSGTLLFHAQDGVNGAELWKSDGTDAGTVMIKDINPGAGNGVITGNLRMHTLGNSLIFQGNDGVNGTELWISDGTAAGTQMLVDLSLGSASSEFDDDLGVVVGNFLFFAASVPDGGLFDHSLYVTDGTAAGTQPIFTLEDLDTDFPEIRFLTYSGGRLFFRAPIDIAVDGTASNFELFAVNVVPEPASLVLIALGGLVSLLARRFR